jgi:type III pantothenate kinase
MIAAVLLAVDIGNTNIAFGVFAGAELQHRFRTATVRTRTVDEYRVLLRQLLQLQDLPPSRIAACIVASVVPPLTELVTRALEQSFGLCPLVVGPGMKTGISVKYENPREVGADRIVNAVAAFDQVRGGVIVVDFGTATTFDCISPRGEYLGGVIVPGVQVSLDALLQRAALLPRVEVAEPPKVVGRNTTHAVQSGVVHGYASLVDGLVGKLRRELAFPCAVLATGGLAQLIVKHTETVDRIEENLTLEGLRLLHERCGSQKRKR